MTSSVMFQRQIQAMYADGVRIFVEFGPKQVLTKLVGEILGQGAAVSAVLGNAGSSKDSDLQLREAAVMLVVLGFPLKDFDPWYLQDKSRAVAAQRKKTTLRLSAATYVSPKTIAKAPWMTGESSSASSESRTPSRKPRGSRTVWSCRPCARRSTKCKPRWGLFVENLKIPNVVSGRASRRHQRLLDAGGWSFSPSTGRCSRPCSTNLVVSAAPPSLKRLSQYMPRKAMSMCRTQDIFPLQTTALSQVRVALRHQWLSMLEASPRQSLQFFAFSLTRPDMMDG